MLPSPYNLLEPMVYRIIVHVDYSINTEKNIIDSTSYTKIIIRICSMFIYIYSIFTCSAGSRGCPNSCCVNSINTAVPSQEHAARRRPHGDQLASNTECVNNS